MKTQKPNFILPKITAISITLVALGLSGCGQKGPLYLADSEQELVTSSEVLESTSQPQDAAFAGVNDGEYERTRYLEEQQVLPEPSDDPNDY
ncbi:LPS translocon maturation chaperone LptM [Psychrobacter sp. 2Y5]|uniref:LPS translocon maturation chaperone LptM n=1 Tax=unclassified Psychrobacter TaxID=196806 RepID=UPI003F473C59